MARPGLDAIGTIWELIFLDTRMVVESKNMFLCVFLVGRRQVTLLTCARAGVALFGRNLQNDKETASGFILVRLLFIVSI